MFDFEKPEHGSEQRYRGRVASWARMQGEPAGKVKHLSWWLLHNCVAHPLIGVLPIRATFDFHDWTSERLNAGKTT